MPIYVTDCRVDWGWPKRTGFERGVIRKYQPELDGGDHGLDSITAILNRASGELPTIEIQALLEYDTRGRTLLLASRGKVRAIEIKDAERRGPYRDLPYLEHDHYASVRCGDATEDARTALAAASGEDVDEHEGEIDVPLHYRSEEAMRDALQVVATFMTGEPDQFVAEVGPRRFLIRLAPGALEVVPLIAWPSTDEPRHAQVIEALLAADRSALFPEVVPTRDRGLDPAAKVEMPIFLRAALYDDLQGEAIRLDRSLSWLVQRAWTVSRDRVRAGERDGLGAGLPPDEGEVRRQALYVPAAMLVEIEAEAARLDSSISWLVRLVWTLARPAIAALPDASG